MAGITLARRDFADARERLQGWAQHRLGAGVQVSELSVANRAAGWSSETLAFTVTGTSLCVVLLAPSWPETFWPHAATVPSEHRTKL